MCIRDRRHPVHSRRTVVGLRESVRLPQHVELPHMCVEAPEAMPGVSLRLRTYPRSQFLHTDRGRCHVLCASLAARFLDQPGPLARPGSLLAVACSWRRPLALPRVLHSAEPSGLPLTFDTLSVPIPPGAFSPGPGGPSPVPIQLFATCGRQEPDAARRGHRPCCGGASSAAFP